MSASAAQPGGWAIRIGQELEPAAAGGNADDRSDDPTMFRVPSYIKTLKPQAYKHQVLSFGLYDRDFENLTRMDRVRLQVVREVFEQLKAGENSSVHSWEDLCVLVAGPADRAQKLRHLYDDGPGESVINPATVRFVLTFDAVFLVVLLLYHHRPARTLLRDFSRIKAIFRQKGVSHEITAAYFDLWLFENQIPLSLVREVWNQICEGNESDDCFNRYIRHTIYSFMDAYLCPRAESVSNSDISFLECNHLLHCLYIAVCHQNPSTEGHEPPQPQPSASASVPTASGPSAAVNDPNQQTRGWMERVLLCRRKPRTSSNDSRSQRSLLPMTELHKAGVRARGVQTSVTNIRFVKSTFFKPTLYIPQIDVDDNTDKVLRNLSSFEVIHSDREHKLISYLSLMDDLINTEEDVRLLRKGEHPVIGVNNLGDDKDIAALFNALGQNVCFKKSELCRTLTKDVHEWCTHGKRLMFIRFMDRFFDRPWIIGSFLAATMLLAMAGLQTVFNIKGYFKQF